MKKTAADSGKILLDAQKIETQCAFAPIADARFNIFYVLSNGGGVYIDGDWFELEEDMLFLTMPDNLYRFDTDGAQLFRVRFSLGAADERWLAPLACDPDSSVFYISGEDVGVFRTFLNEFGSDTVEYDRLMLDAVLAKLAASCEPFGENSTAKRARLYMRSNFRRALTLEECAEYAALAPTYFSEVFKKETELGQAGICEKAAFVYRHADGYGLREVRVRRLREFYPRFRSVFRRITHAVPKKCK